MTKRGVRVGCQRQGIHAGFRWRNPLQAVTGSKRGWFVWFYLRCIMFSCEYQTVFSEGSITQATVCICPMHKLVYCRAVTIAEGNRRLGCRAIQSKSQPTLLRNLLSALSVHEDDVTHQKTVFFIVTAVSTSKPL